MKKKSQRPTHQDSWYSEISVVILQSHDVIYKRNKLKPRSPQCCDMYYY